MTLRTRRNLLCESAATIATGLHSHSDAAEVSPESEWAPVEVNLAYLKSQEKQLGPIMVGLADLFSRRVPIALDKNYDGIPGFMFLIEIVLETGLPEAMSSWTLIHDHGGSILLATDIEQLSIALRHLQKIARKGPARDDKHDAYAKGLPLVVHLPVGITTSMPVHRVA